jgi:predicted kinase
MMKPVQTKPIFVLLYGFPGSGKSFFARQLADELGMAHIHSDRIRYELFENPRFDNKENEVVNQIMDYMTEEFMRAGISVIYDANTPKLAERRMLRDYARKQKFAPLLVWIQIDPESAFYRVMNRDRRKTDDKYSSPIDRTTFEQLAGAMQNPNMNEDYVVISGKHTFSTQKHNVYKTLFNKGLLQSPTGTSGKQVIRPGMVNLVPNPRAGRVDNTRRNISIR